MNLQAYDEQQTANIAIGAGQSMTLSGTTGISTATYGDREHADFAATEGRFARGWIGFRVIVAAKLHTLTGPTNHSAGLPAFVHTTEGSAVELPVGFSKVYAQDERITAIQLHSGTIELI